MKAELFGYMLDHSIFRFTYCIILHCVSCSAKPSRPKCYARDSMSMHKKENVKFFILPINPIRHVTSHMITSKFDLCNKTELKILTCVMMWTGASDCETTMLYLGQQDRTAPVIMFFYTKKYP
jgi:hypothetical protein